ncbi:MAG: methionine--tRNA ligase subunit beta [Candidatus Aadella gelida]|nr:methionine--tRNA ligase subunit beta [Candidatus Aadella gelida]
MISFKDFKDIDLRIAEIKEVKEHPDADKLYVLRIDVGDEEKQIVAGIRGTYSESDLIGKKIIIVNNLEPAVIRGESSNGMLLAVSGENGPVLLSPGPDVVAGAPVK